MALAVLRQLSILVAAGLLSGASNLAGAADAIPDVGPAGEVVKVADGFTFTEGPAWDGKEHLYFTDVGQAKIHTIGPDGTAKLFAENTGPCNGLMFSADGELVACDMGGGRLVAWNVASKELRVLADKYGDKRFNAPNDLVIDAAGGVYFTDPQFRAPQPLPQGGQGVYYRAPDGAVTRVIENLPAPNGILLSIDEKTLYVLPSMTAEMKAYTIEAPGKVGPERAFCTVKNVDGGEGGGCDGATIDERGNLYLTTALGVQVFDAKGASLGTIEFPEQPSNCTFGGADGKTLYVTARTSVYSAPMLVKGHWYAKPKSGIVRIRAGSTEAFTDPDGNTWLPDQGFEGGDVIERAGLEIENTENDELYRSERYSMESFSYAVPNGKYEVKLHFAETFEGIYGDGERVFSFTVNGKEFKDFDVWAKAGGGLKAYVETVPVDVTDGKVTIKFTYNIENPQINGIEIIPLKANAVRINVGSSEAFTDAKGNEWLPDQGFEGGDVIERAGLDIENTENDELYRSERYSMESFSYEEPNGKYEVKLHFAETFEGIYGEGERVFSFTVNGKEFKDFDVWAKAGGGLKAYVETVPVDVTDGKVTIKFDYNIENPQINGIEIIPAS
jgi:gluconolactonase